MGKSEKNLDAVFQDTADAIREKTGSNELINPLDFSDKIKAIPTGTTPTGTINITENGTHDVSNYAEANVNVPQPTGTVAITENGELINIASYAYANVNVPAPEVTVRDSVSGSAISSFVSGKKIANGRDNGAVYIEYYKSDYDGQFKVYVYAGGMDGADLPENYSSSDINQICEDHNFNVAGSTLLVVIPTVCNVDQYTGGVYLWFTINNIPWLEPFDEQKADALIAYIKNLYSGGVVVKDLSGYTLGTISWSDVDSYEIQVSGPGGS